MLTRDDAFPDALTGGPLAAAKKGPLLLTPTAILSAASQAELKRVLAVGKTVYLLGGTAALSTRVADQVKALGYQVIRYAGVNRFATAVAVATALGTPKAIFETTGTDFPDALSAGPAAAKAGGVVVLTDGSTIASSTAGYLASHTGVTRYAVGGPAASADHGAAPIAGVNRFATAVAVAQRFFPGTTGAGLASEANFPDALSAGARLGQLGLPILLSNPNSVPAAVGSFLMQTRSTITAVELYGGTAALSDAVAAQVVANLQ